MPNREPVVAQQDAYTLRHVGPKADIWPDAPASVQTFSVLGQSAMVARPLGSVNAPGSTGFISGSWTGRLGDAGECQVVFPNAVGPDGIPWRERFDASGHNQWLEIYFNGALEFVGCIDQVQVSQQAVTVHCYDAFWLLKKAYERDWTVVQAPRDVIERASQVWVPAAADDFPAAGSSISGSTLTTPNGTWSLIATAGGTVAVSPQGGLLLNEPSGSTAANVQRSAVGVKDTGAWRASISTAGVSLPASANGSLFLAVGESFPGSADTYALDVYQAAGTLTALLQLNGSTVAIGSTTSAPSYELMLESDGEWVSGYLNGALLGQLRRAHPKTVSLLPHFGLAGTGTGAMTATVTSVLCEALQPFLM